MTENRVKICVPVCVAKDDLAAAISRAAEAGDLIELRLDCLPESQRNDAWRNLAQLGNRPFILTLRPKDQGGNAEINLEERFQFWNALDEVPADAMFDLELDLIDEVVSRKTAVVASRVICSHHQFEGEIANVESIYEQMAAIPAAVLKIAVQAEDAIDCLPIFKLLERAQREGRKLIAIAMGTAGIATRILVPARGSFLTYGSLDDETATAPGQLTARELRDVYRIDRIDRQTQIMGLIGRPVSHSLSPQLHNAAFAGSEANAVFIPFEVRDIDAFMRRMVIPGSREIDWNLRGFSVTAPHKTTVMKFLDWIEPAAKEIGAVNTIVLEGGSSRGYNTDAAAFIEVLKGRIASLQNLRCAVIGAGGAARGVGWALRQAGASVSLFARDAAKAKALGDDLRVDSCDLANANFKGFDVVVNATPLGTCGAHEAETPALADQLRGVRLAYDLVYNPLETRFMREARAAECQTIGGLDMLIAQAAEQFRLWMDAQPDVATMRLAAEQALISDTHDSREKI
jgi:3-dehydroquinate dehydratase / shikimate dehydrogenase